MRTLKKALVLLCVLLLLPVLALAESETVSSIEAFQEQLLAYQQEGADSFEIICSADLYATLSADDFSELYRLSYLSGMTNFRLRYSTSGKLQFQQVTFQETIAVAECETLADAEDAIASFLQQDVSSFTLMCSADVFQELYKNGGMFYLMAQQGVADFSLSGTSTNVCFVSNITPMTVPFAAVSSINEAGEKISAWREENVPAFNLIFSKDVYTSLTRDDYRLIAFLGGAESYSLSYSDSARMLIFSSVTYTDVPGAYCTSEDEFVAAIRAMGAQGITSFQLKLDESTYNTLYANSFARLYELEAQAGMTDSSMSFSSVSCMFLFSNAVIVADAEPMSTLDEVIAYVAECVERKDENISLLLKAEVYDSLMDGVASIAASDAKLYDLIANAGIASANSFSFNRSTGSINLYGVQYYAGANILRALSTGDTSTLTAREQEALAAAQQLAADCQRDTQAATALAIHDALCALITYTDDETTDEDDCCIGALLDGKANCDGYADAMLLVGKLADLNVRYQHGDSLNGGLSGMFSTHMWNLIELDGSWRMIDVTWDDSENGAYYLWFNIGEDRASLSHIWSAEMTVPMLAQTDVSARPVAEYTAASADEVTAAASAAQASGVTAFDIYTTEESGLNMIPAREAMLKGVSGSVMYTWVDSLRCLHVELVP